MKKFLMFVAIIILLCSTSYSYDNKTAHRELNKNIVKKFKEDYKKWKEFKNYIFLFDISSLKGQAVTKSGWWYPTTSEESYTAEKWIIEGGYSADEPEVPAAYRHFYDPLQIDGKYHLTDINKAVALFNPQINAIDWHFIGNDPTNVNEWTWNAGKDYLVKAIATSNESEREGLLAKAYRCLGEVLHNTADMGCPPHVRNDSHGGMGLGGPDPYESLFNPYMVASNYAGQIGDIYKNTFEETKTAMDINIELSKFTNSLFFSDETISGKGVENYTSRNGKKDYPNPKLEKLIYEEDTFNYYSLMPSGRKVEMCNDQSILLGYLTQNFRSYPRVTKKNVNSQATELIPMIVDAGKQVMRRFFPILEISISINYKEKKLTGIVKHLPSYEYPSSVVYNGKIGLMVDGAITSHSTNCTKGNFEFSEIDTKMPTNKKVQVYLMIGDWRVVSDEILNEILDPPTISYVQNLSDKWKSIGMGFAGDTIKILGKFPGVNANNLKVKFISYNGLAEANVISFGSTEIRAVVPFAKSSNDIYPSAVKMFVEINSVRTQEVSFNLQNWWFPEFCKFKVFTSEIKAKLTFDNGNSFEQNIFAIESTYPPATDWDVKNIKCNSTNFSFDINYTNSFGAKIVGKANGFFPSKSNGREVTLSFDIETYYVKEDNNIKKVEIKTYKQFRIENLNYYSTWSGGKGNSYYYENPSFSENIYESPELINKIKITKFEIETIETDKKASPPTQKVTTTKLTKIENAILFNINFGVFID